jgi:hypothetical protein
LAEEGSVRVERLPGKVRQNPVYAWYFSGKGRGPIDGYSDTIRHKTTPGTFVEVRGGSRTFAVSILEKHVVG